MCLYIRDTRWCPIALAPRRWTVDNFNLCLHCSCILYTVNRLRSNVHGAAADGETAGVHAMQCVGLVWRRGSNERQIYMWRLSKYKFPRFRLRILRERVAATDKILETNVNIICTDGEVNVRCKKMCAQHAHIRVYTLHVLMYIYTIHFMT